MVETVLGSETDEKNKPQKSNELVPKNGHILKESPFPKPTKLGIQPLVFGDVDPLKFKSPDTQIARHSLKPEIY